MLQACHNFAHLHSFNSPPLLYILFPSALQDVFHTCRENRVRRYQLALLYPTANLCCCILTKEASLKYAIEYLILSQLAEEHPSCSTFYQVHFRQESAYWAGRSSSLCDRLRTANAHLLLQVSTQRLFLLVTKRAYTPRALRGHRTSSDETA